MNPEELFKFTLLMTEGTARIQVEKEELVYVVASNWTDAAQKVEDMIQHLNKNDAKATYKIHKIETVKAMFIK